MVPWFTPKILRCAIVGNGPTGAATAAFLAQSGCCDITVFERSPAIQPKDGVPTGAGLGIQPIGLRVLQRLGLLERVVDHGARINGILARTINDRTVLDLAYGDLDESLFGLGLHRDVLQDALKSKLDEAKNVEVRHGCDIVGVRVPFMLGFLEMADGSLEGPFDLVVSAGGRSGVLRQAAKAQGHMSWEQWYNYGCLWAILPDRVGFLEGRQNTLTQRVKGCQKMLGFLPTGRRGVVGPEGDDPQLVSLFWSLEMSKAAEVRAAGIDAWKEEVLSMEPLAEGLIEQIKSFDDLIEAYYSNVVMPNMRYGTNLVFVGDEAHACSPQLGQGANLGLVDAWMLSELLKKSNYDVIPALRAFDEQRRWRLRFYQLNSMLLTPVFQSNSRVVGALRDLTMGPMCRFPLTRRQMLATLVGAQKNGIPFSTIDEDEYKLAPRNP